MMTGAGAGEPARYRIEPLRLAAAAEDLDAWIERAAPGDICIYARGGWLADGPLARRARALAEAGIVRLHRRAAEGGAEYIAVRLSAAHWRDQTGKDGLPARDSNARRVYDILANAAAHGHACPTNREIACALALPDAAAAGHLVRQLVRAGHIAIENRGPWTTRIATIRATGARTCESRMKVGAAFAHAGGVK